MHVALRAGERLYINGGVISVDRKVMIELLNDMTFLLGGHVIQADEATTPLKQLYFVIQTMMMDPHGNDSVPQLARRMTHDAIASFEDRSILAALKHVDELVALAQPLAAMKLLRLNFDREREIMFPVTGKAKINAA
jgi:flagellar protein FlbT